MKTKKSSTRSGSALVLISVSMVAAGLLGAAMLSSLTAARQQRLYFDIGNRAYYAAESGRAYVHARRETEPDYVPDGTFTLENGEQFILSSVVDGTNLNVTVTGIANIGTHREARQQLTFRLSLVPDEPAFDFGDVFVYGSELIFRGRTLEGAGGTVIIRGGLETSDVNRGASLAVTTLYFDGDVTLTSGSTSLGSSTDPGAIYVNGDLTLTGGARDIYGDVYVSGDLTLANARIHGNIYVAGNVTLRWGAPTLGPESYIYYVGSLSAPGSYPSSVMDRLVQQPSVPGFEVPGDQVPTLHPDQWYADRGYVSGGTPVDGIRIFAEDYTFRRTGNWPTAEDVVIVSENDIVLDNLGGSGLIGVLIAPYGKVTFDGPFFEGLVLSRDGFHVVSGGTIVTFRNITEFFASEDDIPVQSE